MIGILESQQAELAPQQKCALQFHGKVGTCFHNMVDILRSEADSVHIQDFQSAESVVIPPWLAQQGKEWIQLPGVESVVLFGSRVTGHASSFSDWDVAVLYRTLIKPSLHYTDETQKHHVDLTWLSVSRFASESHLVGTLAHELAKHSAVIEGAKPFVGNKETTVMSETALERHLEHAFKDLARAINEVVSGWEYSGFREPIEGVVAGDASGSSANGAERVAKALCVYLGITYTFTHDVEELAKIVPPEWRSKVLSMNGNTSSAHVAHYTGEVETIGDVAIRIKCTLDLLSEILVPCLNALTNERIAELTGLLRVSPDVQTFERLLQKGGPHADIQTLVEAFDSVTAVLRKHQHS